MNAAGIIVEYNPFHNGHLYHLRRTKELTGADCIIAVMSGNFLQRGEPAIVSKFSRAKMAVRAGADLVVELPYSFSTQKADVFAFGAVSILDALGCRHLCFGSESGKIEEFFQTETLISSNEARFQASIQKWIKTGVSYPRACALAFQEIDTNSGTVDLSQPNNTLGYAYIRALKRIGSPIRPLTIRRLEAGYLDEGLSSSGISSATGIRKTIFEKGLEKVASHVPRETLEELSNFRAKYGHFASWDRFWPFLRYRLLQAVPEELRRIYEMEEGLEYRFIETAKKAPDFRTFMERLKTKRYTWTRLQRACVHVLTNTTKEEMALRMEKPAYIRLLGLSKTGRNYLKENKSSISLPVLSKMDAWKSDMARLDVRASRIYAFGFDSDAREDLIGQDFNQPPVFPENPLRNG
jgi:Protein of unknown function (DUF795).